MDKKVVWLWLSVSQSNTPVSSQVCSRTLKVSCYAMLVLFYVDLTDIPLFTFFPPLLCSRPQLQQEVLLSQGFIFSPRTTNRLKVGPLPSSCSWGQFPLSHIQIFRRSSSWELIHWHKTTRGGWLTQKGINFRNFKAHPWWQISPNETIAPNTSKMVPPSNYQAYCHIWKSIKAPSNLSSLSCFGFGILWQ